MKDADKGIIINDLYWSRASIRDGELSRSKSIQDTALVDFIEMWFDDEDSFWGQTSGSTGIPKKMKIAKADCRASAMATLTYFSLKEGQTALLSMPAQYIAGRMMVVRAIVGGLNLLTTTVSSCPILPNRTLDLTAFTPHQFSNMISTGQFPIPHTMSVVLLGGAPVSRELIDQIPKSSANIYETFGMTETYSHVAIKAIYPSSQSYFEAVPGVNFTVVDQRLKIHAPHINQPDLLTNDRVDLLSDTRFVWIGRFDFVINSGGVKLSPEVLEDKLNPYIEEPFYFYGAPDQTLGQRLVLVMESKENFDMKNLKNILYEHLSKLERPKEIIFVSRMIFTKSGKLDRRRTFLENQSSIQ
ncbi:AMP-binding protein [Membranihabitans marinus]|uniref:AMP-binding protein n=1 Tax=Membranihabitans marinus TaxID=1227546 RepID=UPI001F2847E7|nr:AMP-binding protein [Membranihabitans marinus]